jgi:hypothetical protein
MLLGALKRAPTCPSAANSLIQYEYNITDFRKRFGTAYFVATIKTVRPAISRQRPWQDLPYSNTSAAAPRHVRKRDRAAHPAGDGAVSRITCSPAETSR